MRVSPRLLIRFEAPKQGRPMAWPYTYASRWSQFNFAYHWKMAWPMRYLFYSWIIMIPVIWKIDRMVNSPAAKLAYKKSKELEHKKEHEAHRWHDISGRLANR